MKDVNIIEEFKILDIAIGKKMFELSKINETNKVPSPLQFKILNFLLKNKGKNVCQKTLETNLNVSKATISAVLSTMEYNGIISRSKSGADAREKNIQLTELSKNKFEDMKKINEMINTKLLEDISEEELNIFLSLLDKMKKNINTLKEEEK